MKRTNQILWGVVLVGIGLVLGLNAFGVTHIDLLFDGWWTLFIIIPGLVGLCSGRDIIGNLIVLCVGIFLLLCCRDILDFGMLWKLLLPAVIVLFGVKLIFGNRVDRDSAMAMKQLEAEGAPLRSGTAVFSGERMDCSGELFRGAELNAVFGSVECDLRNAVIDRDCVIRASAVFGGIDIFVPGDVNIRVSSNSLFGMASDKTSNPRDDSAPTVYIRANCLFGGVDIK